MRKILFRIVTAVMAAVLVMAVVPAAAAADDGWDRLFPVVNDFDSSGITDADGSWAKEYIRLCYNRNLMTGVPGNRFNPKGTVPVSQGVAAVAKMHAIINGNSTDFVDYDTWYSGDLEYARKNGLLEGVNFTDNFNRDVTRGELSRMLYNLLLPLCGEDSFINDVSYIADVREGDPYYTSTVYLMDMGIVKGYDEYGTFRPYNNMTRQEMATIVAMVVDPSLRQRFESVKKPADYTVYSTEYFLGINGGYIPGVFEINGEYYFNFENMWDYRAYIYDYEGVVQGSISFEEYDTGYQFYLDLFTSTFDTAVIPEPLTCGRRKVGTARPSELALNANITRNIDFYGVREEKTFKDAVVTLRGRYPMVRLAALGYTINGNLIDLNCGIPNEFMPDYEEDLVGPAIKNLQRSSSRDTALALHDYLVNTCTYDPLTAAASYFMAAMIEEAGRLQEQAREKYDTNYNIFLASGYGVCENYADTYLEMCLRSGIPCERCVGMANGGGGWGDHAWNRVYVDDSWLYVDVTWDDPLSSKPVLDHDYFLVTFEKISRDHIEMEEGDIFFPF